MKNNIPICLNVDNATNFLKSFSSIALVPATIIVMRLTLYNTTFILYVSRSG